MIRVQNLTKTYGDQHAVDTISFEVATGEILGFLGPNGAGKTTTMKIITCFMPATSGNVEVDGLDVFDHSLEVRRKIGYLPETTPLYPEMNVAEYLEFIQALRQMPISSRNSRMKEMVELCGLGEVMHKDIGELSKGYRQRVGLAQAIIHDPEILILDEPTIGLDPNQVVEIRQLISTLGERKTLILCTHILSEVEAACNRVLIINHGKIVADGTPETLRAGLQGKQRLFVQIKADGDTDAVPQKLATLPETEITVRPSTEAGTVGVEITSGSDNDVREQIFRAVADAGWVLLEMRREVQSLEDVFRDLTRGE
jgi:ABC-2 type transport system ATP-binding protein